MTRRFKAGCFVRRSTACQDERSSRMWMGALLGVVLLLSTACAAPRESPSSAPPPVTSQLPVDTDGIGDRDVGDAVDPLAPSSNPPVARSGPAAPIKINGRSGAFSAASPVAYSDGVVVRVTAAKSGVEGGKGPGAIPGRPYVAFTIQIDNKSNASVDVGQVVVTTTYGFPARVAAPVYEDDIATDFTGTLKPGMKSSAVYVFAVPARHRRQVSTSVDFDATHIAAIFAGGVG